MKPVLFVILIVIILAGDLVSFMGIGSPVGEGQSFQKGAAFLQISPGQFAATGSFPFNTPFTSVPNVTFTPTTVTTVSQPLVLTHQFPLPSVAKGALISFDTNSSIGDVTSPVMQSITVTPSTRGELAVLNAHSRTSNVPGRAVSSIIDNASSTWTLRSSVQSVSGLIVRIEQWTAMIFSTAHVTVNVTWAATGSLPVMGETISLYKNAIGVGATATHFQNTANAGDSISITPFQQASWLVGGVTVADLSVCSIITAGAGQTMRSSDQKTGITGCPTNKRGNYDQEDVSRDLPFAFTYSESWSPNSQSGGDALSVIEILSGQCNSSTWNVYPNTYTELYNSRCFETQTTQQFLSSTISFGFVCSFTNSSATINLQPENAVSLYPFPMNPSWEPIIAQNLTGTTSNLCNGTPQIIQTSPVAATPSGPLLFRVTGVCTANCGNAVQISLTSVWIAMATILQPIVQITNLTVTQSGFTITWTTDIPSFSVTNINFSWQATICTDNTDTC